eukprot:5071031-Prymnesium_polylepis.2
MLAPSTVHARTRTASSRSALDTGPLRSGSQRAHKTPEHNRVPSRGASTSRPHRPTRPPPDVRSVRSLWRERSLHGLVDGIVDAALRRDPRDSHPRAAH